MSREVREERRKAESDVMQHSGGPKTAANVSGTGWMMVVSGLKTLLETGEPLDG